jgi:hypothetical protein
MCSHCANLSLFCPWGNWATRGKSIQEVWWNVCTSNTSLQVQLVPVHIHLVPSKGRKLGKVLSRYFSSYGGDGKNSWPVDCALDEGLAGEPRSCNCMFIFWDFLKTHFGLCIIRMNSSSLKMQFIVNFDQNGNKYCTKSELSWKFF